MSILVTLEYKAEKQKAAIDALQKKIKRIALQQCAPCADPNCNCGGDCSWDYKTAKRQETREQHLSDALKQLKRTVALIAQYKRQTTSTNGK